MERNWDTIREILIKAEELKPNTDLTLDDFESSREDEIIYHVRLLDEAGLVTVEITDMLSSGQFIDVNRLTWSGHEFLDSIRNETVWSNTKKTFTEKGGVMSFDLIKSVAIKLTASLMGI